LTPEEVETATKPSPIISIGIQDEMGLKRIQEIADEAIERISLHDEVKEVAGKSIADIAKIDREARERRDREDQILRMKLDGLNCTHFGNADRFLTRHRESVRYCPPFDWWYIWSDDEGRWGRDERGAVSELGKAVILKIYEEASKAPTEDRRKTLAAWAIRCETPGTVSQMLEVARTSPDVVLMPDHFDQENNLINLQNGYYDLLQHLLIPHDRQHFFSMLLPFNYDPKATCQGWLAFLDRIFRTNPEKEKIVSFLQRAVGYTLTGDTSERAIFLMHGLGANGKTVFIRVLEALFGDYGASVSSSCFTTAMATNVRNDLARLTGKRFVWASENSSETVLDEEMIKRASGGDTVVCRFLFKEEFEYRPNFKIWWIFNHKPKIKDATDSLWDRFHLIPCEERIPFEEQDKRITGKLTKELPGIFNWAIAGLIEYQKIGLFAPASVKDATSEYRRSEDALDDFLHEMCEEVKYETLDGIITSDTRTPFKIIWEAWKNYTTANNEKIRTKQWLGRQLEGRYKKYRTGDEKGYIGLKVKYSYPVG
jgi:putative DNA primase/helicase